MMAINGEEIMDRFEVWSVRQRSTDGEVSEVACPDGEGEARRLQKVFGGQIWKRTGYVTAGGPVAELSDEDTFDLV